MKRRHNNSRAADDLPRMLIGILTLVSCGFMLAQTNQTETKAPGEHDPRLRDFQVIEFRQYIIKEGQRKPFSQYFDAYFPEALQQLGTIVFGSFFDRKNESGFTWIRGFHTMDDRGIGNGNFYFGPVWNEHRATVNELITNADNVLLLTPLNPARGVPVFPAVDPVKEVNGAQGIVVAAVFPIKPDGIEEFARQAEPIFAAYRAAGAREAGILVTLEARNDFPQLPFRTDGPFLVWLGILKDLNTLDNGFRPVAEKLSATLKATNLLRGAPQLIDLSPTPRSRLRWISS